MQPKNRRGTRNGYNVMPFLVVRKWMEGQAAAIRCPSRDGSGERRGTNDEIAVNSPGYRIEA